MFLRDTLFRYLQMMLLAALPAAVLFAGLRPYRKRTLAAMGLRSSPLREGALLLFGAIVSGVLVMTLLPDFVVEPAATTDGMWGDVRLLVCRYGPFYRVNLVPFHMLSDYRWELQKGGWAFTLLNLGGNLAVFVPFGLFPALLWRGAWWQRAAKTGFIISAFIEIGQYFVARSTDIDDVILNTLGAMLGYGLFVLLRWRAPQFTTRFQCEEVEALDGRTTGDPDPSRGAGTGQL